MLLIVYLTALIAAVCGAGELTVLSYPKSISFKHHENLKQSLLADVYSTALGFSIPKGNSWSGMYILDPFNLPECLVTVFVDGVGNIGDMGHRFTLRNDESELSTWASLQTRVKDRYPFGDNTLARINLDDGIDAIKGIDNFDKLKSADLPNIRYLNRTVQEDDRFLRDIELLNSIANLVEEQGVGEARPAVYWLSVGSLHGLVDLHGVNSSERREGEELLAGALQGLAHAFSRSCHDNALVTAATSDNSHTRRLARAAPAATPEPELPQDMPKNMDLNLAKNYNADYPVIFNIILWFGVAMFFSLLAISLVIGNMDPGRDSIIYRMTSNRMKKDN